MTLLEKLALEGGKNRYYTHRKYEKNGSNSKKEKIMIFSLHSKNKYIKMLIIYIHFIFDTL